MNKIRIIEKHINGVLDIQEVCELLSCSERTVYRMKKQLITLGPPGLIHGLKGKPSNHQGDTTKYANILRIVKGNNKYLDFGPTLLSQHLETIEDGNKYLTESYLEDHNKRFAVVAKEGGDAHSKLTEQEKRDIERYFAKEVVRTVKNDGTVQYKHKTYQLKKGLILKSKLITVKENIYGNVRLYDGTDCLRGTETP